MKERNASLRLCYMLIHDYADRTNAWNRIIMIAREVAGKQSKLACQLSCWLDSTQICKISTERRTSRYDSTVNK